MAVLVNELLVAEIWNEKVFPVIKEEVCEKAVLLIKPYLVIAHEMTLVNLLEMTMFHKDACVRIGEPLMELVDFAFRRVHWLLAEYRRQQPFST